MCLVVLAEIILDSYIPYTNLHQLASPSLAILFDLPHRAVHQPDTLAPIPLAICEHLLLTHQPMADFPIR